MHPWEVITKPYRCSECGRFMHGGEVFLGYSCFDDEGKPHIAHRECVEATAQTPVLEKHAGRVTTQATIQTKGHAKNEDSRDV